MYRIHHLEQSRSHRIVWLAEELELDYELITYRRDPKTLRAPAELNQLHPLGKSPLLEDGKRIISESAVIIEYLLDRHENLLRPAPRTDKRDDYCYWLHFAESSLMPILFAQLLLSRTTQSPVPALFRPITRSVSAGMDKAFFNPELSQLIDYLRQHLREHPYFCGEHFSAADIQMAYPLSALAKESKPLADWYARVTSRPAQQRAVAKGAAIERPGG